MDERTRSELLKATEALLSGDNWAAIEELWRPLLEQADLEARVQLACIYHFNGFDEGRVKNHEMQALLRVAAESGNADAMYCLAVMTLPRGSERDALVKEAAQAGNIEAQRDLGVYYATGDWTGPKDEVRAVHWYRLAAERGHADAQYNLGFMLLLGQGSPRDVREGMRWLRLSAEQGDWSAIRLLADLYETGYCGAPIDPVEAAIWKKRLHEIETGRQEWSPETEEG